MTTWEEAMEQCLGPHDICDPEGCSVHQALATIRKHIEDQEEELRDVQDENHALHRRSEQLDARVLDQAKQLADLKGLIIDQDSKIDVQTHQLNDLMDANIYQQGHIEELEKVLADAPASLVIAGTDSDEFGAWWHRAVDALHPSEPRPTSDLPPMGYPLHPSEPETG